MCAASSVCRLLLEALGLELIFVDLNVIHQYGLNIEEPAAIHDELDANDRQIPVRFNGIFVATVEWPTELRAIKSQVSRFDQIS